MFILSIWTVFANLAFLISLATFAVIIGHGILELLTQRSRRDR